MPDTLRLRRFEFWEHDKKAPVFDFKLQEFSHLVKILDFVKVPGQPKETIKEIQWKSSQDCSQKYPTKWWTPIHKTMQFIKNNEEFHIQLGIKLKGTKLLKAKLLQLKLKKKPKIKIC